MSTTGADGKALLAAFLEVLLQRLLLEAAGRNAVEIAADAALALILAEPAAFRSLGALLRLQTLRNLCISSTQEEGLVHLHEAFAEWIWGQPMADRLIRKRACPLWFAGANMLALQHDPEMLAALTRALTKLMDSNGVQQSLDRQNRRVFRCNLRTFVSEARSILRRR